MSLKIWLPFVNDVNNQGLAGNINSYSLNGFASDSNGKIGKCYSGLGIYHLSEDILDNTWSLALWVKATAWGVNNDILLCKNNNESTSCQFYMSVINGKTFNIGINGGSSTGYYSYTFSTNTWYHLAATYNGSTYKLYLNGNEVKSASTTAAKINGLLNIGIGCRSTNASGTTQTGYTATKYYNDVRIYNHCLSPKEVKEISKGLVLHYPLNRGGFGCDNLLAKYVVPGQNGPTSTETGGRTNWLGDYKIKIPATENADTYFRLFTTKQLTANATYTISCKVDGLLNGSYYRFPLFAQGNTGMGVLQLDHNGLCYLTFTMTYGTQTTVTGANGETVYICFMDDSARSLASGQGAITVSNFKLEEGSTPTPWIPNSADVLYSSIGLDSNIEYDVSGYQNNGTITGTLNYSSDTPKYSVSTAFDGTQKILTPSFTSEIKTMSVWVKTTKDKNTSQFVCADSASKLCISFYKGCIISYFASSGHSTGSKCALGSSYIENGWNHIVVVSTGSGTRDVYCNGVKLTPTTNDYWSYTSAGFTVGARNSNTPRYFYGYISDVRAYATALSADDILDLYHTPASIANNGTLMTQGELSEV